MKEIIKTPTTNELELNAQQVESYTTNIKVRYKLKMSFS